MEYPLTGRLVAAARALTGISQEELANASGLEVEKVRLMESNGAAWIPDQPSQALSHALEKFGVVVIREGDGMGAGVRLKFTRQDVRQIGRLEGEGGPARPDDVP
jgi:transcriptional regulator with XRE-family HTH domain